MFHPHDIVKYRVGPVLWQVLHATAQCVCFGLLFAKLLVKEEFMAADNTKPNENSLLAIFCSPYRSSDNLI